MSIPALPVVLDISSVKATRNGGVGPAEPYLLTVFFKVDGETMRVVPRADGKLVLAGDPVVRRTDSRHGNLPPVRDGQTVAVPDRVGRAQLRLQPIPLPGALGDAVVGGASGVAGVVYVLAEQDKSPDDAILAGYNALVNQLTAELRALVGSIVVDPATPGASPLTISEPVIEGITARVSTKVKQAVKAASGPFQKLAQALNKDDIIGNEVLLLTEAGLIADRAQSGTTDFRGPDVRGDWTVSWSATATVPADFTRRRRVTIDLDKLTCVSPGEVAGDEPYLWNAFFTVDGTTVTLRDSLRLAGRAAVTTTPGSHRNLEPGGVGAGQTVHIPDPVGRTTMVLDLIRFPASVSGSLVGGVSGVAGCVSVLLEQDLVADSAAEAGHQAFNAEVTRILDELIPTLGLGNVTPSPEDLAAASGRIAEKVREAVLEEGNILQDLFAGADADDVVGFNVFLFPHKALLAEPRATITATYGDAGRYQVAGTVTAVPA
jgi:hypothetical protein